MIFEAHYHCFQSSNPSPDIIIPSIGIDHFGFLRSKMCAALFKSKGLLRRFACVRDDTLEEEQENLCQSTNPNEMSPRFLKHCKGDEEKASKMWREMISWRQQHDMDRALFRPLPLFRSIKIHYPQALHGVTKSGNLVFYEKPGVLNIPGLKKQKIGPKEMAKYTAFVHEYIFSRLIKTDDGRFMSVLDVQGVSWGIISRDSIDILRAMTDTIQNNYPERVSNLMIINAPEWFAGFWKMVERVLAGGIERVTIHLEEDTLDALLEHLDSDEIPPEYGGTSPYSLGQHPYEADLRCLVDMLNANAKITEIAAGIIREPENTAPCHSEQEVSTPCRKAKDTVIEDEFTSCRKATETVIEDEESSDEESPSKAEGIISWSGLMTENTNENSPKPKSQNVSWNTLREVFTPM